LEIQFNPPYQLLYIKQKGGKISVGGNVMLAGFGVGYSWAGCILEYGKE
jgi:3-oxoacyl-[acyl-carrier-protein] synthase III